MGILFGLTAALAWGVADFWTAKLTKSIGVLRSLGYTQAISLGIICVLLLFYAHQRPDATLWLVCAGMGAAHVVGTFLLYRAFAVGTLAVVAPIVAAYVLVTAGLGLLTGDKLSLLIVLGALTLLAGVGLITQQDEGGKTSKGVKEALGGAACFGLVFWSLDQVHDQIGYLWPLLSLRLAAVIGSFAAMRVAGKWRAKAGEPPQLKEFAATPYQPRRTLGKWTWWEARPLIIGVALGDTIAWLALSAGISGGQSGGSTTIVTALSSLSHGVTVLLAWLLLRDKLAPLQWAGVAVALLGVVLLSV